MRLFNGYVSDLLSSFLFLYSVDRSSRHRFLLVTNSMHFFMYLFHLSTCFERGPSSVVGIATAYGLEGPGIESRWGEIFRTSPDRP